MEPLRTATGSGAVGGAALPGLVRLAGSPTLATLAGWNEQDRPSRALLSTCSCQVPVSPRVFLTLCVAIHCTGNDTMYCSDTAVI